MYRRIKGIRKIEILGRGRIIFMKFFYGARIVLSVVRVRYLCGVRGKKRQGGERGVRME